MAEAAGIVNVLRSFVEERTPHNRALRLRLLTAGSTEVMCMLPYGRALAGDAESGAIDEGAIAALIDVTCGSAVCMHLGRMQPIATLELRIDFVRPSLPDRPLTALGHCYQVRNSVAFVRASVHDGDPGDLLASAQGTFIVIED